MERQTKNAEQGIQQRLGARTRSLSEASQSIEATLIHLCACAVKGIDPDVHVIEGISIEELFQLAQKHLLTAAVGMALESAGIKEQRFTQAIAQAQRKNALLDADRAKVLAALEEAGIWYMPLRGAILKDLYPRYGMRQMADNDILFDPRRRADVKAIMETLGFSMEEYGQSNDDVYHKKPVSNFEMHVSLFNSRNNNQLASYYSDVKDRLIKDEGNRYGYHFSDEDFYLFLIAHEYKHYTLGGTGLRSLLDTYVYLQRKGNNLDWNYIRCQAKELCISDFEQQNRELALKLFDGKPLAESEKKMLNYMFSSGTYGTFENSVSHQIKRKGRLGYFLSKLALPYEIILAKYPVLKKLPFLYPIIWVWGLFYLFFTYRGKMLYALKAALGLVKKEK